MSDPNRPPARPVDIVLAPSNEVLVSWSDGHASVYDAAFLRKECPCATCRDERERPKAPEPPKGALKMYPGKWVDKVEPTRLEYVGNYALGIVWNDGHQSGIYSFRFLRELCPCDECRARAAAAAAEPAGGAPSA